MVAGRVRIPGSIGQFQTAKTKNKSSPEPAKKVTTSIPSNKESKTKGKLNKNMLMKRDLKIVPFNIGQELNIVVIGAKRVGKTSLVKQFTSLGFEPSKSTPPTIPVISISPGTNNLHYPIRIIDTDGTNLAGKPANQAHVYVFVYDSVDSFKKYSDFRDLINDAPVLFVQNKCDIHREPLIGTTAKEKLQQNEKLQSFFWMLASATSPESTRKVFETAISLLLYPPFALVTFDGKMSPKFKETLSIIFWILKTESADPQQQDFLGPETLLSFQNCFVFKEKNCVTVSGDIESFLNCLSFSGENNKGLSEEKWIAYNQKLLDEGSYDVIWSYLTFLGYNHQLLMRKSIRYFPIEKDEEVFLSKMGSNYLQALFNKKPRFGSGKKVQENVFPICPLYKSMSPKDFASYWKYQTTLDYKKACKFFRVTGYTGNFEDAFIIRFKRDRKPRDGSYICALVGPVKLSMALLSKDNFAYTFEVSKSGDLVSATRDVGGAALTYLFVSSPTMMKFNFLREKCDSIWFLYDTEENLNESRKFYENHCKDYDVPIAILGLSPSGGLQDSVKKFKNTITSKKVITQTLAIHPLSDSKLSGLKNPRDLEKLSNALCFWRKETAYSKYFMFITVGVLGVAGVAAAAYWYNKKQ